MARTANARGSIRNGDPGVYAGGLAKLTEASAIARSATVLGAEGLSERAFQTLLEAEPLIHHSQVLLNGSSVTRRRERGDVPFD